MTNYVVESLGLDPHSKLVDIASLVPPYLLSHLQDPGAADDRRLCSSAGKTT